MTVLILLGSKGLQTRMKTMVVAGQARKVGKTSVLAALIRALRSLGWTAVKISRHRGRIPHLERASQRRVGREPGFLLTEENAVSSTCDTGRFLAAGARRALWLRVRSENFPDGFRALWQAVKKEKWIMIESNSILDHLTPTLCLLVLDNPQRAFKASARKLLPRADAILQMERPSGPRRNSMEAPPGIPVFSVPRDRYQTRRLLRFVRQKLELSPASRLGPSSTKRSRRVSPEQE